MCPCVVRRPGLCEAYFTSNRMFLILKASEPYILTLSAKHEKHLEKNFLEIVKLDTEGIMSIHFDTALPPFGLPDTPNLSDLIIPYGICAVSDKPSDIYIALWEESFSRHDGCGEGLWSLKARLWLVCSIADLFRLSPGFRGTINGVHRCHENLDVLVNSFSVLGQQHNRFVSREAIIMNPSSVYRKFFAGIIRQCNDALHYCVRTQKIRPELEARQLSLVDSVIENFGQKRIFATVSDGQPAFYTANNSSVKSLQASCIYLLRDLLLPEDIHLLPLPHKLIDTLQYGVAWDPGL